MEQIVSLVKRCMPWRFKIWIKLWLADFPGLYPVLAKLRLVRHGDMDSWDYAIKVFESHFNRYRQGAGFRVDFTCLEVGCGDSIATGVVAYYFGARETFLVDSGNYARLNPEVYADLIKIMNSRFPDKQVGELPRDFGEFCSKFRFQYLTGGLSSLASLRSESVDFCFSQAVLEHVYLEEFRPFSQELFRVMRKDSFSSHVVDLQDHLEGSLNNLRFPECTWESSRFKKSSFYTNRLRMFEVLEVFSGVGFKVDVYAKTTWSRLPISREKLDLKFKKYPEEELLISGFSVRLEKVSL